MSDPLELAQKHVLLKNGIFDFQLDSFRSGTCICTHPKMDHLDCTTICLSKEPCICDRFLDKESKPIIPQKRDGNSKLSRKEDALQEETRQLDIYIQTLARV
jgi:hypothetical protein